MTVSWDEAFSIPMLEMCCSPCGCSPSHCVFIDDVLYMYRYDTPINDYKTKSELQKKVLAYVRGLRPYRPINDLFGAEEKAQEIERFRTYRKCMVFKKRKS